MSADAPENKIDGYNHKEKPAAQSTGDGASMERDIEENLKRVYQATLNQAVPDRFVQLLAQLRKKEGKP